MKRKRSGKLLRCSHVLQNARPTAPQFSFLNSLRQSQHPEARKRVDVQSDALALSNSAATVLFLPSSPEVSQQSNTSERRASSKPMFVSLHVVLCERKTISNCSGGICVDGFEAMYCTIIRFPGDRLNCDPSKRMKKAKIPALSLPTHLRLSRAPSPRPLSFAQPLPRAWHSPLLTKVCASIECPDLAV